MSQKKMLQIVIKWEESIFPQLLSITILGKPFCNINSAHKILRFLTSPIEYLKIVLPFIALFGKFESKRPPPKKIQN